MAASSWDAVVVGAGLAGLVAARDLSAAGRSVVVLEGRDRIGGRAFHGPFDGRDDVAVELGGQYFVSSRQHELRAEIERYGIAVGLDPGGGEARWRTGGELRSGLPVPADELIALERGAAAIIAASHALTPGVAYDDQDLAALDEPYGAFLDRLDLPAATRDLLESFPRFFAGAPAEQLRLLHVVDWVAQLDNSVWAQYAALDETFADGSGSLARALAEDGGADLRLSTRVTAIEDRGGRVRVRTADGDEHEAPAAIVTAPVETWEAIEFDPPLSRARNAAVAGGHRVRTAKQWLLVENVPRRVACAGIGSAFEWLSVERRVDGAALCVGFAGLPERLGERDLPTLQQAVEEYLPGARVVATDCHDWLADPFARGTSFRPRVQAALRRPHGRVHFAGADVALRWPAWMAGALESGGEVAAALLAADGGDRT
jgi:monoamine oxidase